MLSLGYEDYSSPVSIGGSARLYWPTNQNFRTTDPPTGASLDVTAYMQAGSGSRFNADGTGFWGAQFGKFGRDVGKATIYGGTGKALSLGANNTADMVRIPSAGIVEYTDNAAAIAASRVAGDLYRTGDLLKIVH